MDAKWAVIHTTKNLDKEEATTCDVFNRLIQIQWSEYVTRLARATMLERSFFKDFQIPSPEDVKELNDHISREIKRFGPEQLKETNEDTFRRCVILAQACLLIKNKRRSGEIDQIT